MSDTSTAIQPPYFSEMHASTIIAAAGDHPDADGLLVHIPTQRALVCASFVDGVVDRWVVESPVTAYDLWKRQADLGQAGLKFECLVMDTDMLVPLSAAGLN